MIEALYAASAAGVKIELFVRGVCCLRPGIKGVRSNITVRSVVDRFLEHSRVFYFENACRPEVFVGSADWMPHNFFRRIETVFPVEDGRLRERLSQEVLGITLADNTHAALLRRDGLYQRSSPAGGESRRCQEEFIRLAERAARLGGSRKGKKDDFPQVKLRPGPFEVTSASGRARRHP